MLIMGNPDVLAAAQALSIALTASTVESAPASAIEPAEPKALLPAPDPVTTLARTPTGHWKD